DQPGARHALGQLAAGPGGHHRVRLHPVCREACARAGPGAARARVRRRRSPQRDGHRSHPLERGAAQPRVDPDRVRPAHDRERDPARGRAVVPGRRGPTPQPVVGDDDRRRHRPAPERDPPHARAGSDARARGARRQRLRRRRPRCPRPALPDPAGALMARFIVRRSISTVVVLFAISIVTFLIFEAIPNGDPAARLAGRTSTPETVAAIRHTWGFDKPIYDQYLLTMKNVFTGKVISYTQQVNVLDQIVQGLPATMSLA